MGQRFSKYDTSRFATRARPLDLADRCALGGDTEPFVVIVAAARAGKLLLVAVIFLTRHVWLAKGVVVRQNTFRSSWRYIRTLGASTINIATANVLRLKKSSNSTTGSSSFFVTKMHLYASFAGDSLFIFLLYYLC